MHLKAIYPMSALLRMSVFLVLPFLAAGCGSGGKASHLRDLDNPSIPTRLDAVTYLGEEKEVAAVPKLIELLSSNQPASIRLASIQALGLIKKKDAVDALILALADTDPAIRAAACDALGQLGDARATTPLIGLLAQPAENLVAIWALGEVGGDEAIPALNALLTHSDPYVQFNATRSLKNLANNH